MHRKFLVAVMIAVVVVCLGQPPALAKPGDVPVLSTQKDKATVYKVDAAGVQFTVPANWEVEKDKNGTVTVSKKENDTYVVISVTVLPTDPSLTLDKEFA